MKSAPHKQSAFSLLELLVSITIISLLVGGAVAGYTRYTDRQRLVAAAEKLQSGLRQAQNMAKVGYLGDCDELSYINFTAEIVSLDDLVYEISIHCAEGTSTSYPQLTIDSGLLLNSDMSINFYPFGYLDGTYTRTLSSTRINYQADFNIDQGGGIRVTYY